LFDAFCCAAAFHVAADYLTFRLLRNSPQMNGDGATKLICARRRRSSPLARTTTQQRHNIKGRKEEEGDSAKIGCVHNRRQFVRTLQGINTQIVIKGNVDQRNVKHPHESLSDSKS
jgi:hypothetical protein